MLYSAVFCCKLESGDSWSVPKVSLNLFLKSEFQDRVNSCTLYRKNEHFWERKDQIIVINAFTKIYYCVFNYWIILYLFIYFY